jgi:hypothetical protein
MMSNMLARWTFALMILASWPLAAMADDTSPLDARLQGYKDGIALPPASTATQWLALVGLGVVGVGIMFMNARRSHLD